MAGITNTTATGTTSVTFVARWCTPLLLPKCKWPEYVPDLCPSDFASCSLDGWAHRAFKGDALQHALRQLSLRTDGKNRIAYISGLWLENVWWILVVELGYTEQVDEEWEH